MHKLHAFFLPIRSQRRTHSMSDTPPRSRRSTGKRGPPSPSTHHRLHSPNTRAPCPTQLRHTVSVNDSDGYTPKRHQSQKPNTNTLDLQSGSQSLFNTHKFITNINIPDTLKSKSSVDAAAKFLSMIPTAFSPHHSQAVVSIHPFSSFLYRSMTHFSLIL